MNKTLYSWLIFFPGLSVVSALLQNIIYFLLGQQIFMLDSFDSWFVIINITAFIGSMLLLKYYSSQRYWFVLAAGAFHGFRRAGVEGQGRRQDHADRLLAAVGQREVVAHAFAVEVHVGLGRDRGAQEGFGSAHG